MVSARQTKDKDKAKALFETKSFRFKPTKRCLKFKQAMYCENNCKPNPYGAMALRGKLNTHNLMIVLMK